MSKFIASKFDTLEAYTPGEQPQDKKYIKLNTNESPFPPSPAVIAAVNSDEVSDLRLYSDPRCWQVRKTAAEVFGVEPKNVFVSNGSDESLNFLFMAMCPGGAAFADITYGFYRVFGDLYSLDCEVIPLREDFTLNPDDYRGTDKTIFIANPNAPTGLTIAAAQIASLAAEKPDRLVVVDEAYVDFGGESVVPLTKKYKNLVVVGTFSKSRSLAGARLGFAVADAEIIADLDKIRYSTNPYNVNRLTLVAGQAALRDTAYFDQCRTAIMETREYTKAELKKRGFFVTDSMANFLFVKPCGIGGKDYYLKLKDRGVLVRYFGSPRIADFVRITIGTMDDMKIFVRETDQILAEVNEHEKAVD